MIILLAGFHSVIQGRLQGKKDMNGLTQLRALSIMIPTWQTGSSRCCDNDMTAVGKQRLTTLFVTGGTHAWF